jgi:hypothetical protein
VQGDDEGQRRIGRIEIGKLGVLPNGLRVAFGDEQALRIKNLAGGSPKWAAASGAPSRASAKCDDAWANCFSTNSL